MEINIAIILITFQALISDEIINTYETAVEFVKRYNVTQPCIVRNYNPEKYLKEGNLVITPINLKDLVKLINELKQNPLIKINEKQKSSVEQCTQARDTALTNQK